MQKIVISCYLFGHMNVQEEKADGSFYEFLASEHRRVRWNAVLKCENWMYGSTSQICSEHFVSASVYSYSLFWCLAPCLLCCL